MTGPRWRMDEPDRYDKWFGVYGPNDLFLKVDYDDVDHDTVLTTTRAMVDALNAVPSWPERVTVAPVEEAP